MHRIGHRILIGIIRFKSVALVIATILIALILFAALANKPSNISCFSCRGQVEGLLLSTVIAAGLADGINPCAFSILAFFITFLFALGKTRSDVLGNGLTYVGSLYLTYLLIGLGFLETFTLFDIPHLVAKIGAVVIVVIGLINIKDYFWYGKGPSLKITRVSKNVIINLVHKSTVPSAILLGVVVGLCEFPCSGAVYVTTLGLLATQRLYLQGLVYLLIYNVMFVMPLLIILVIASNRRIVVKINGWRESRRRHLKLVSGLLMVDIGLILYAISSL